MRILARFQIVRHWITQDNICFSDGYTIAVLPSKALSIQAPFPILCQTLKEEGYYQGLQLSPDLLSAFLLSDYFHRCEKNGSSPGISLRHQRLQDHQVLLLSLAGGLGMWSPCLFEGFASDTVYGPAGFGFVGDPYVFHQGTAPTRYPRLLMQLEFGINTYKTWYFNNQLRKVPENNRKKQSTSLTSINTVPTSTIQAKPIYRKRPN